MSSKIIIFLLAYIAMVIAIEDVQPCKIETNDKQGMLNACSKTIQNCQTALSQVNGSGSLIALTLNLELTALVGPLLISVVALLAPLLSGLLPLVIKLLAVILAALAKSVTLVVKLLSGTISKTSYTQQANQCENDTTNNINSYSNTGLNGILADVLKLVLNILDICLSLDVDLDL